MKTLVSCGAIILNDTSDILLVRRSQTDSRRPLQWDLPGGHVEPSESLEAGLVREVEEETALDISSLAPRLIYASSHAFEEVSVTWLFFIVKVQTNEVALSPEHDQYQWVNLADAIEMVEYDRKRDALIYFRDNHLLV